MTEKDVIELIEEEIGIKVEMDTEGQWDSLDYITVVQRLDEELGGQVDGKIPEQELATMTTPRKIIALLKKHKLVE